MSGFPWASSSCSPPLQSGEYSNTPLLFNQDLCGFPWASPPFLPCPESGEYNDMPPLVKQDLCAAPAQPSKGSEGMDKQWLHRVIETKRRKEMKSRYSQLTSLLPAKANMDHTSIADRLSEAIDYISHLKEKINELAKKRDEMKMKAKMNKGNQYCYRKQGNVITLSECDAFPLVNVSHVGSRVQVTTNTLKEHMMFSELLLAVEEQGLRILNASSFGSDEKVFHTVHCKVLHTQSFKSDFKLKQTLWQLIERNRTPHLPRIDI